MSSRPHDDMSQGFIPNSISSSNGKNFPQAPIPSSDLLKVPPEPRLACPVSSCNFVHEGKRAKRNLMSHLNRPKISRRTGQEKAAWLNLHRIALNRILAATGFNPLHIHNPIGMLANRVLVANRADLFDNRISRKRQGVCRKREGCRIRVACKTHGDN